MDQIVKSGDVDLAVYRWGNPDAEQTILMVHGYPDSARIWEKTATLLADRYQVIAYDVRGAGASSRPKKISDYRLPLLVEDMAAVVNALSPNRPVHLVAHDWGSIQSWEAVTTDTLRGRIASYTTISGPSLDHAGHWIRRRMRTRSLRDKAALLKQLGHSWYIGLFHFPALAPSMWRLGGNALWPLALKNVEGLTEPQCEHQGADGLFGINLYRANVLSRISRPQQRYANIPVHLIFPLNDHFMIEEIWQDLRQWVAQLWRSDVQAGHWLPLSHPELLAEKVDEFVRHIEGGPASAALQQAKQRANAMPVATQKDQTGAKRWLPQHSHAQ